MTKDIKNVKKTLHSIDCAANGIHLEVDESGDGFKLFVSGIKRISSLSDDSVSLRYRRGGVTVLGKKLTLAVYEDKTVEISGKIEGIEFANTKN